MPWGIVAENRRVWRSCGILLRMAPTSSIKPISSIRSASSRTTVSHQPRERVPPFRRSRTRPGVPTTTWEPLRSFAICPLAWTPPTSSTTCRSRPLPRASITSATCWASSRVGVRIIPWTATRWVSILATSGAPKPIVLPVPVSALPMMSPPPRIGSITFSWMGVQLVIPIASRLERTSAGRSKALKGFPENLPVILDEPSEPSSADASAIGCFSCSSIRFGLPL